jgi:TolB-like protein/Tfp pilus assembly protein PilF
MSVQGFHGAYEFGPFCLDTQERVLLRDGRRLPLKPKVYETLLALVVRSGHLVHKEELMREVWPDVIVEENNLTGNIFALRRAFAGCDYIETVPRRGYRFTAEVKQVRIDNTNLAETGVQIREPGGVRREAIGSLAVLPFVNAGADPDMEYLSDGVTESIINNLSQLSQLRVMSRNSVFRYKGQTVDIQEIGRQLNVDAVLMGRVLQHRENLIVRVELVDPRDGAQWWGEQYNRKPADILEIQSQIASEISEKLRVRLSRAERRRLAVRHAADPEAYQLYLRALYFLNRRSEADSERAIKYFKKSIAVDPHLALSYTGLAVAYIRSALYGYITSTEAFTNAKAAAVKAAEIDDTLSELHTVLGGIKLFFEWDFADAEREFQLALQLNPNDVTGRLGYADLLCVTSRHDEAIAQIRLAQELDPFDLGISMNVGDFLFYGRRYEEAIEQYKKTLEMDPHFTRARLRVAPALLYAGHPNEALTALAPVSNESAVRTSLLAQIYAATGKQKRALRLLTQLEQDTANHFLTGETIAAAYAAVGEKDKAFALLNKACDERSSQVIFVNVDPAFDSLRSDQRFAGILARSGIK